MASNSKQYGLILPQKANQGLVRDRPSVFNDDSESEEETGATDWVKKALKRESEKTFQKKQNQINILKVLEEDPTVYQYDEVYDTIAEKKAELLHTKRQQDKKPRYIQSLLQQAEKRKREHERRNERIIQKEREAEGDKFKDKESFVTSAYRQKLEEFKKLDEEEMRQDAIEALTDVSKQKDLSGFYRHLYRQTVSGEQEDVPVKLDSDEPTEKSNEKSKAENEETGVKSETEKNDESNVPISGNKLNSDQPDKRNSSRRYRRRRNSSASSKSEDGKTNLRTADNVDADSDFSDSSDSSESGSDESMKNEEHRNEKNKNKDEGKKLSDGTVENSCVPSKDTEKSGNNHGKRSNEDLGATTNKKIKVENEVNSETEVLNKEKKVSVPKPNIWIKRTIGEVFESALQRYYQRKADKLASKG